MKLLSYLLLPFLVLSITTCYAQTNNNLSTSQFEAAILGNDSAQVLDVRTPGEYNGGHIKGALLADWNEAKEFDRRISFIDKNKPVYIYCLSGGRSSAAAEKMRRIGFRQVYELQGGITAWKTDEKPVEGRSGEEQMSLDEFNSSIQASPVVLVDFGAEWCPPCKKMEPVLASLQKNYPGKFTLLKVDGGRDLTLLKKYNITELPVFILFKDGKQFWRKNGIVGESELAELVTSQ